MNAGLTGARVRLSKFADGLDKMEKGALGARGPIKDIFEVLQGGGAVVGLTFGAHVLKNMATEAARLRDEFNKGNISAGELTESLIQSVPVIGTIRQAGLAIQELFTGSAAAIAKMNDEAAQANRIADLYVTSLQSMQKFHQDNLQTLKDIRRETELIGAPAITKTLAGFTAQQEAATQRADEVRDMQARAIREGKLLAELKAKADQARKAVPESLPYAAPGMRGGTAYRLREEAIKVAELALKAATSAETKELERRTTEIARIEQEHAAVVAAIRGRATAEQTQAMLEEGERQAKLYEQQVADQISRMKADTEKVLEIKRQAAMHMLDQFITDVPLEDIKLTPFNPAGFEAIERYRRQNESMERRSESIFSTPADERSEATPAGAGAEIAKLGKLETESLALEKKYAADIATIARKLGGGDSVGVLTLGGA